MNMKKIIRVVLVLLVLILAVRFCASKLGNVITIPGMTEKETTEDNGGWFRPKEKTEEKFGMEIQKMVVVIRYVVYCLIMMDIC